jgi:ribonuclease BN (tRNA processing enzyme)
VAVSRDGRGPSLVLDAGTGIRNLTGLLGEAPFRGSVLLSHLHWDHTTGLPFCRAIDRDDAQVDLVMPSDPEDDPAAAVFARVMSPPHFPIGLDGLAGRWSIRGIDPGRHHVEGFDVTAGEVAHKGGRTFGYRISDGRVSIAYLPDHDAALDRDASRALVAGVDVLIHDAQFTASEERWARAYGHATIDEAVALASDAGAGLLVLFHHAPTRTDEQLDALVLPERVVLAREGAHLDL